MSRFRQQLKSLPVVMLVSCIGATGAAYAGQWHWLLELFSHFRLQYVATLVLLAVFYAWRRRFLGLGIAVLAGVLNVIPIASLLASNVGSPLSASAEPWVLVSANLYSRNNNVAAVLDHLAAEQADLIVLQEYTPRWAADLVQLQSRYPHHFGLPLKDQFGLALYSRWPLRSAEAILLGDSSAAIVAEVATANGPVRIIAVHLRPPTRRHWAAQQARQFEALTELAANTDMPLAVVGDFNAAPWSSHFRRWTSTTGMHIGRGVQGLAYTWPTSMPLLWIPIDTCVVNSGLQIVTQRRGSRIGSDHYPLVTTLVTRHD